MIKFKIFKKKLTDGFGSGSQTFTTTSLCFIINVKIEDFSWFDLQYF